jgi:hypothetical protein
MDNKKLMHILLRDIRELEMLVEELKQPGDFDQMDRELLLTRISGVRHLLEYAAGNQESHIEITPATEKSKQEPALLHEKPEIHTGSHDPGYKAEETPLIQKPVENRTNETEMVRIKPAATKEAVPVKEELPMPAELELEEEQAQIPEKQILGEKFVAGKSVNDLLLEKGKSDSRFSNLPVSNLGNAVTTNDKFLFIRELFEGNTDEYNEAVRNIDSMATIHDAAAFLRENFKWKKNETSLKFIDLVKRRFLR